MVPVLKSNNYSLLDGESSVFTSELQHRPGFAAAAAMPPKRTKKVRSDKERRA